MSLCKRAWMLLPLAAVACSGSDVSEDVPDHHDHDGDEAIGSVSSELTLQSPVSSAVSSGCSTTSVKALSEQLIREIQCLKPGAMKRIDNIPGVSLGPAVFPYLQTPAANALAKAQRHRGSTLVLNSGLRTLPQQYLLHRWSKVGACGIGLAASPGTSNHETGIAIDISDYSGWRPAMFANTFSWLGPSDPVHFDYAGSGTVSMRGLSVLAFQRLWNRNNPSDKIAEDGAYGPKTEARLARSPVGGFAIGASCTSIPTSFEFLTDESTPNPVPDATEPAEDPSETAPASTPDNASEDTDVTAPSAAAAAQGCAAAPGTFGTTGMPIALGLLGAGLVLRRRQRR